MTTSHLDNSIGEKGEDMKRLGGLKVSVCQMNVAPGETQKNVDYIIGEVEAAARRGMDIVIFPEMCTIGYFIGDKLEDVYFLEDVLRHNRRIIKATECGVTAIFGTVVTSEGKDEDGRPRKHNAAIVASKGKAIGAVLGGTVKSLQPDYRFFNDDKHFYSLRQMAEEFAEQYRATNGKEGIKNCALRDLLTPVEIETSKGVVKTGVILCEDMWHGDYAFNPTKVLVEKGAELVVNLSASPWTWQKNRKRHQIVKTLLTECRAPFIY